MKIKIIIERTTKQGNRHRTSEAISHRIRRIVDCAHTFNVNAVVRYSFAEWEPSRVFIFHVTHACKQYRAISNNFASFIVSIDLP